MPVEDTNLEKTNTDYDKAFDIMVVNRGEVYNNIQRHLHREQKIMEFEELRSGKSVAYYMYKTIKFGSK